MTANDITLKATDFKYPTKEELQKVKASRPKLARLNFPIVSELSVLTDPTISLEDIARGSQLYWWNHALANRLGSLEHAYTTALVNHDRGLPDDIRQYKEEHYINRVQFGFYSETYFYFFGSVRDTVAQLVNIYANTRLQDHQVYFSDKFFKKIKDRNLKDLLIGFADLTARTADIRNSLAHRYLPTHDDNRPRITFQNGTPTLEVVRSERIKSSELLEEIKKSFRQLGDFLDALKTELSV